MEEQFKTWQHLINLQVLQIWERQSVQFMYRDAPTSRSRQLLSLAHGVHCITVLLEPSAFCLLFKHRTSIPSADSITIGQATKLIVFSILIYV